MIQSKSALARPFIILAGLSFGGAAILVTSLVDAWDISLLRNAMLQTLFTFLVIGGGCSFMELMSRSEAEAMAARAEKAGKPVDPREASLARTLETWIAVAALVAFTGAPMFAAYRAAEIEAERMTTRAEAIERTERALSEADRRKNAAVQLCELVGGLEGLVTGDPSRNELGTLLQGVDFDCAQERASGGAAPEPPGR